MRKRILALFLLGPALCPHAASAQSTWSSANTLTPETASPAPPVEDPLLAPVPRAKRVLSSWAEAAASLRSRSTDLRIAIDQVRQARARTRIALARYLPTIEASGAYLHNFVTRHSTTLLPVFTGLGLSTSFTAPIADTFTANVEVSQTVVDVAALDQWHIDEVGEEAAQLSAEDVHRTLLLGLADEIVAVVTAERSAEINRVGLRRALEETAIVKERQALGGATAIDVVRSEQNAADARAALVAGDEALRESREALGLAIGVPEETAVAHDLNVNGIADDAMASCHPVDTIDERSDVVAARKNLELAKRTLRNVYYRFLPTIQAQSAVNATSIVPIGYPNPTWSVLGLLSIPIWDGGARYGALTSDRAAEDTAEQRLEAVRRQDVIDVMQAERGLDVAQQASVVAIQQRDLAAKNDDLIREAYLAGQETSLELVTASEAHRAAELNLALKEFAAVRARLTAVLALASCPP